MKKYIGTKQIEAEPMTMGEADNKKLVAIGSSRLSKYEKSSEGYHVKYDDRVETWLPKDEFEKTYRCSETSIDKMLIEAADLNEKAKNLGNFIDSEKHKWLSTQKKNLLKAQYAAIVSLSTIILERIRVEKEEQRLIEKINQDPSFNCDPHCGCTCGCDTADCGCTCGSGCNCQEGKSSQAENAG